MSIASNTSMGNRISIISYGSLGDIIPYIALGKGLKEAGFEVRIIAHESYRERVESLGMEFRCGCMEARDLLQSKEGMHWLTQKPIRSLRNLSDIIKPHLKDIAEQTLSAAYGSDMIVFSIIGGIVAHDIAEYLKIPAVGAFVAPLTPTKLMSNFLLPYELPFNFLNKLSFTLPYKLISDAYIKVVNEVRTDVLKLKPLPKGQSHIWTGENSDQKVIYGISPNICPRPQDWGDWVKIAGYWFPDFEDDFVPDERLSDFIQSREKQPFYFGFGSMIKENAEETYHIIKKALKNSNARGVLSRGWGAIAGYDDDDIIVVDYVPHKWLFPKVTGVVHHGGAGTTAQAFRAGVPQVIAPFFADQYFWARRVFQLGCGPKALPQNTLTSEKLCNLIKTVKSNIEYSKNAKRIANLITTEDGISKAVGFF